jgi:hypothetical protein
MVPCKSAGGFARGGAASTRFLGSQFADGFGEVIAHGAVGQVRGQYHYWPCLRPARRKTWRPVSKSARPRLPWRVRDGSRSPYCTRLTASAGPSARMSLDIWKL